MHVGDHYIAIDWGTSNRRAYLMSEDGIVLDRLRDDRGVLAIESGGFPHEFASLRTRFGPLPMIAAGMVGSTRGLREAPYVPAPADLASLAASCVLVENEDMLIVPGVSLRTELRADVMRGEEVQVLGAIASGMAPVDALFAQPGTHNKWIDVSTARITDFATAMTGELFGLLRTHGILAGMLDARILDGAAFRDGLARGAGARDLAVALFEVRTGVLLGVRPPEDAAAFASGVLIGADVGARDLSGRIVYLLAGGVLADLYAVAIAHAGGQAIHLDSQAAFVAGIHQIRKLTR